jgi:hypothetical protein
MERSDLLGRWNIDTWMHRYDDGRISYPMGQALEGFIYYAADTVFVTIAKQFRPAMGHHARDATPEQRAAAFDSYFSYTGTWMVDGDVVLHALELSLWPDWAHGKQLRRGHIEDGVLQLSGRVAHGTRDAYNAVLRWKRAR